MLALFTAVDPLYPLGTAKTTAMASFDHPPLRRVGLQVRFLERRHYRPCLLFLAPLT
jgi:hypothetical protein